MFAIIYLGIAYLLGFALCRFFFPGLSDFAQRDMRGETLPLSPLFVMLPAWLYLGILPLTWTAYLLAVLYAVATRETENPLLPANIAGRRIPASQILRQTPSDPSGKTLVLFCARTGNHRLCALRRADDASDALDASCAGRAALCRRVRIRGFYAAPVHDPLVFQRHQFPDYLHAFRGKRRKISLPVHVPLRQSGISRSAVGCGV